ncbi:MAG TPA: GspMb/PilO family protein, partial [Gemmatimonadaceae bacterium]|nr:GspMb/PilO family protein [Gemmatimonadaceae bacterium]
ALARERAAVMSARKNPQLQHVADSAMRAVHPRLFEGKDDVMASAELAAYVGDMARRSRVWLQDAGTRPSGAATSGLRTLHVEVRAESDLNGTLAFLQALERGQKLVRIDRLDISHSPRASEKDGETLAIVATISGFALVESATPSNTVPAASAPSVSAPAALTQKPMNGDTP